MMITNNTQVRHMKQPENGGDLTDAMQAKPVS